MATLRSVTSSLLSRGVLSAGWESVLTGAVLLFLAWCLAGVGDDDPVAPYVAVVLLLAGVWRVERGLRAELMRRPRPTDGAR